MICITFIKYIPVELNQRSDFINWFNFTIKVCNINFNNVLFIQIYLFIYIYYIHGKVFLRFKINNGLLVEYFVLIN